MSIDADFQNFLVKKNRLSKEDLRSIVSLMEDKIPAPIWEVDAFGIDRVYKDTAAAGNIYITTSTPHSNRCSRYPYKNTRHYCCQGSF